MASKPSQKIPLPPENNTPLPLAFCESPEGMLLSLLIQPRASRNAFVGIHNAKLKISLTSPPANNKANEALCQLLAQAFGIPKTNIQLLSGHTSRHKKVLLRGPYAQLANTLEKLLSTKLAPNFRL